MQRSSHPELGPLSASLALHPELAINHQVEAGKQLRRGGKGGSAQRLQRTNLVSSKGLAAVSGWLEEESIPRSPIRLNCCGGPCGLQVSAAQPRGASTQLGVQALPRMHSRGGIIGRWSCYRVCGWLCPWIPHCLSPQSTVRPNFINTHHPEPH